MLAVNAGWASFGSDGKDWAAAAPWGVNYLEVCFAADRPPSREGVRAALGVPCPASVWSTCAAAPPGQTWFLMMVVALQHGRGRPS